MATPRDDEAGRERNPSAAPYMRVLAIGIALLAGPLTWLIQSVLRPAMRSHPAAKLAWSLSAVIALAACARTPRPMPVADADDVHVVMLLQSPLAFEAGARVTHAPGAGRLTVYLTASTLGDTAVQIVSNASNCEPSLEFENTVSGRRFVWSHVAWRRKHEPQSPPPSSDVTCVGTDVIATVDKAHAREFGQQSYSIDQILGDSIPAGSYRVLVTAVISRRSRRDTLSLWTPDVELR